MARRPDLDAMVLFARVLQHGSFSEAARRTGTPVSTLSRKISALERRLGVRLLERTTRSVTPTDSGREYALYCDGSSMRWTAPARHSSSARRR
jgi:DNA-binding transcriptional LysR family regulator